MVRRWRIRTRVLAVPFVPATALLVVVGFDLHRTPVTVAVAVAATLVGVLVAVAVERSITGPLRALTRLAADRRSFAEADGTARPADDLTATRSMRAGGELADLALAVADGRRAAIDTITDQRSARRSLSDLVGVVALRNEQLLASALAVLDDMARRDLDPATTATVARVHRLVARVDRATAAELVLLGRSSTVVRAPATVTDTVWAAALAIESSDRVDALAFPAAQIAASAVADVAHLLAELLDNAVRVSSPGGRVTVLGESAASGGFDISVVDTGHGLGASDLATANRRVRRLDPLERLSADGIGLDVVGRLARRHGIDVQLGTATAGGVAALVRLPAEIITAVPDDVDREAGVVGEEASSDEPAAIAMDAAPAVDAPPLEPAPIADEGPVAESESVRDVEPVVVPVLDLVAEERPARPELPAHAGADDLLPRRQPKWAAAIAARSRP